MEARVYQPPLLHRCVPPTRKFYVLSTFSTSPPGQLRIPSRFLGQSNPHAKSLHFCFRHPIHSPRTQKRRRVATILLLQCIRTLYRHLSPSISVVPTPLRDRPLARLKISEYSAALENRGRASGVITPGDIPWILAPEGALIVSK